jgi:hypothetical protein
MRDELAHVDTGGFGAEDADLKGLGVHQAHRGWGQGDDDGSLGGGLGVSDGEFAPGGIDGGVEEAELEVGFDGDVLGEPVSVAGGRFNEDILAVEAEAFVCDFDGGDFEGT